MDSFVGEIRIFPYTFAPYEWAYCNGAQLSVAQNQALFAVIGTTYGGDGNTYFLLPQLMPVAGDLGYVPMGTGSGPGLTPRALSKDGIGDELVALTVQQIPPHTHPLNVQTTTVTTDFISDPTSAFIGRGYAKDANAGYNTFAVLDPAMKTTLRSDALAPAGSSPDIPHNNLQPCLTMNFCISLYGEFPMRP